MIFEKKKILVWYDDPPEDRVISIVAGCLANHDRAHSRPETRGIDRRVLDELWDLSLGHRTGDGEV